MNFEPAAPLCGKALQANRGEFIGQDEMDERLEQILLLQKCASADPSCGRLAFDKLPLHAVVATRKCRINCDEILSPLID